MFEQKVDEQIIEIGTLFCWALVQTYMRLEFNRC